MTKTVHPGFFPHLHPAAVGINRPHGHLPLPEVLFYMLTGVVSISYVTYELCSASQEFLPYLNQQDFVTGWSFTGHKKDVTDYEWNFWSRYFWEILPWVLGHIFLARIIESKFLQFRKLLFLAYSLLSVVYIHGYRTVLFLMCHALICFLASYTGSFVFVWVISLILLSTLNYAPLTEIMSKLCGLGRSRDSYYPFMFVLAFVILRYTSFCLERSSYIRDRKTAGKKKVSKEAEGYSFFDLLLYMFYIPLFFTGPVITYDRFRIQINSAPSPWTSDRILSLLKGFIRVLFWTLFLELCHHYVYYTALQSNADILWRMSAWAMVGIGYLEGQLFMVKYLIMYDLPGLVARMDDLDPPLGPKCISYIYRYSDMWKYFDRGFYTFLRNYIYIPMGGSKAGILRRLLATKMCFAYIYMWHGEEYYLLLWSLANYVGCLLELSGGYLERSQFVVSVKSKLSAAMIRRIRCIIVVPLFLTSCFAIFYFFGGIAAGDVYIQRFVLKASYSSLLVLYFLIYANLQNAMEVERWLATKHKTD